MGDGDWQRCEFWSDCGRARALLCLLPRHPRNRRSEHALTHTHTHTGARAHLSCRPDFMITGAINLEMSTGSAARDYEDVAKKGKWISVTIRQNFT